MLDATRSLVALRRRHAWLHGARTTVEHLTNTALALRSATDTDALLTVINLGDEEVVLSDTGTTQVDAGEARLDGSALRVRPRGWAVLR